MSKKPVAIISAGYWFRIAVPIDKLTETVKMLTDAVKVDASWTGDKNVWYRAESQPNLTIEIVDEVLDTKPEEPKKDEAQAA